MVTGKKGLVLVGHVGGAHLGAPLRSAGDSVCKAKPKDRFKESQWRTGAAVSVATILRVFVSTISPVDGKACLPSMLKVTQPG